MFSSATTATEPENSPLSTIVYNATANNDIGVTYSFDTAGGADYSLFNLNGTTGAVSFKTSPNYESPSDSGANNVYNFTIRATDTANNTTNQSLALSITNVTESISLAGQSIIDLGSYGKLIAPIHIDTDGNGIKDSCYYHWDRSGNGTAESADRVIHNTLDEVFNHDSNGMANTTVANIDGNHATTDIYRYATLNGVDVALPTIGTNLAYSTITTYLADNQAYSDLTEIWDTYNSGYLTNGTPAN